MSACIEVAGGVGFGIATDGEAADDLQEELWVVGLGITAAFHNIILVAIQ